MIDIKNLEFEYFDRDEEGNLTDMVNAIRGINFSAKKGEFIAIAGRNGSGKSTFARIMNRITEPMDGVVMICGYDASDSENVLEIRKKVGMVFQNPDDQMVGSIVEEDVAFGAENIGIERKNLRKLVDKAMSDTGMVDYAKKRINELSGGEKQKVSIAGVLAMQPECIVLDEATSMLDPASREEILAVLKKLNAENKITIIIITHIMSELMLADTVYVFDKGRIVLKGRPIDIFADRDRLIKYGLERSMITEITEVLRTNGILKKNGLYDYKTLVMELKKEYPYAFSLEKKEIICTPATKKLDPVSAILFNHVDFGYGRNKILENVSFALSKGEYGVIVGAAGAGKSTLLQLIPRLEKPKSGEIYVDGIDVNDKTTDLQKLRSKIGFLFQYPENQLFAENVYEDVVFGARNTGLSEIQAEKQAYEAIKLVGLPQQVYDIPIDKLSGGQKRRVALAGVLAMNPSYLILDEPTAGLDPEGKRELLDIIDILHKESDMTILLVSHDMDEVARRADRVIAMDNGRIVYDGEPTMAFYEMYKATGNKAQLPEIMKLLIEANEQGLEIDTISCDIKEGLEILCSGLGIN